MSQSSTWKVGADAWVEFVRRHPELGYKTGFWQLHNFLRLHREALVAHDAIRLAKNKFWIANVERFCTVAFDCATGAMPVTKEAA